MGHCTSGNSIISFLQCVFIYLFVWAIIWECKGLGCTERVNVTYIKHGDAARQQSKAAAGTDGLTPPLTTSGVSLTLHSLTAFTRPTMRDRYYSVDFQADKEVHRRIINNLLKRIVPAILDTTDKWQGRSVYVYPSQCLCV